MASPSSGSWCRNCSHGKKFMAPTSVRDLSSGVQPEDLVATELLGLDLGGNGGRVVATTLAPANAALARAGVLGLGEELDGLEARAEVGTRGRQNDEDLGLADGANAKYRVGRGSSSGECRARNPPPWESTP
eukprot:gnl/Ergobibamus_cyprinoides/4123.p1 GENE.gnl/Ergobibamus_cyprinoides/4123~~gnl/Ergobibamus_cyprinoides/4123.p1  ORF type:complete len:132 (+),score=8.34 gnl/Ergobibamus_cyprinoides/4123:277-672(+)